MMWVDTVLWGVLVWLIISLMRVMKHYTIQRDGLVECRKVHDELTEVLHLQIKEYGQDGKDMRKFCQLLMGFVEAGDLDVSIKPLMDMIAHSEKRIVRAEIHAITEPKEKKQ